MLDVLAYWGGKDCSDSVVGKWNDSHPSSVL